MIPDLKEDSRASAERWVRRFRHHYTHERPNQALNG